VNFQGSPAGHRLGKPAQTAGRSWLLGLGAAVLALLAAYLTYGYLNTSAPTVDVVVAAREIPANHFIKAEDLKIDRRPRAGLPTDAAVTVEAIVGKLARGTLLPGDVVRAGHVASREGGSLAALAEHYPDKRLVSLSAEMAEGLFGQLATGDRLDVLGELQLQTKTVNEARIGVLAAGVPVVAVNQPAGSGLGGAANGGSLLVAVSPTQAQAIKLAQAVGKVYLMISSTDKPATTPVMTPQSVLPTPADQFAPPTK
jgi:Flp pilus assembly protein CpaB